MKHHLAAIAACLTLAGCGGGSDAADAPVGRQMRETDTSRLAPGAVAGGRVDAETMRVRRVAGTWRGRAGADRIEAVFGNDGTLSVQVERDGGVVDAATGRWALKEGLLEGSLTGGASVLAAYSRWRGAFANDTTINLSGANGAIVSLKRPTG